VRGFLPIVREQVLHRDPRIGKLRPTPAIDDFNWVEHERIMIGNWRDFMTATAVLRRKRKTLLTIGSSKRPSRHTSRYFDQSSTARPGTRPKSERLPVTIVALSSRPIAAIHKSFLPTLSLRALS